MLQEIRKVHQAGDLDAAESQYREWVSANPDDHEAWFLLAALRRQRNDLFGALEFALHAVQLAPGNANYHAALGGYFLEARQITDARDGFANALRLDPNHLGAAIGLAQAATMLREFDRARDALATAERLAPNHPRVLMQKAGLAQLRGDHQAAVKLYMEAAKRDGSDPVIHANLGRSLDALGNSAFAEQALRNALQIKPDYSAARILLGQVLAKAGRLDEAMSAYQQVLAERPGHPMALIGCADVLRITGNLPGALDHYRNAYAAAPELPGLVVSLTQTLLASGAESDARALLDEALARSPADPDLRRLSLAIAARQGDAAYRQAMNAWLDVDPGNLDARTSMFHHHELLAEYEQADAIARETLAVDSRSAFARLLLARSALRAGDAQQAQEQINLVPPSSLLPAQRAERARLRGLARDRLGDWPGAVEAWIDSHRQSEGEAPLVPMPQRAGQIAALSPADEAPESTEPVFLIGLPGAGAESLAALLDQCGVRVLTDRFQPGGRGDAISTGRFVDIAQRAAREASAINEFRDSYRTRLSAINASGADLVDWLPFADLRLVELLRAAFPSARFLLIQRDLRDCLLNWLALGCHQHLVGSDPPAMGAWLARAAEHLTEIRNRLATEHLLTIDGCELNDADRLCRKLMAFLGLGDRQRQQTFNVLAGRGGLPTALPDGHWQSYQTALAPAFASLASPTDQS